jgi:HD superfamily phosphodiesterase
MKHYYEFLLELPVHLLSDSYEYIKRSDAAHNEEHIRAVVRAADDLADRSELPPSIRPHLMAAALMHDLGCAIRGGRDIHETLSAQIAYGLLKDCGMYLEPNIVLPAIRKHRASYTGERTGKIEKILAAADRCDTLNLGLLFYRSAVYAMDAYDVCEDVAIAHSHEHIATKYKSTGRGCLLNNCMMMEFYPEECREITARMETITVEEVRQLVMEFKK